MNPNKSTATGQRSLAAHDTTYPLWPPRTKGCPDNSTLDTQYPLEIDYDYESITPEIFHQSINSGLDQWQPLLPPLAPHSSLGEGGTPLTQSTELAEWLELDEPVYIKDESQNPTWSQKDRLNRCTVSAAIGVDAAGIVVSSSGNHGASAAAYASRTDLPCIVLTSPDTPTAVQRFLLAYDAAVIAVEGWGARQRAVDKFAEEYNYHPVSSRTYVHTGHPFGPEGYKTIAYEIYQQLDDQAPGSVFVPTAAAELLYGVWKGFRELASFDLIDDTPQMVSCEPAARGPLAKAIATDTEIVSVEANDTDAHSIQATRNSYRGVKAIQESDGLASTFTEPQLQESQQWLSEIGIWQESSGAAGVAGLSATLEENEEVSTPVVCLATSSGFKDGASAQVPHSAPEWGEITATVQQAYDIVL